MPPGTGLLTDLLQCLAREQINLSSLCVDTARGKQASFCLSRDDYEQAAKLIEKLLLPHHVYPEIARSIGTLTLYPHRSRLEILGALLAVMGRENLPIHALSSSISALAINTDFHKLDQAAQALKSVFSLPENHSPFQQQMSSSAAAIEGIDCQLRPTIETAATYWEPVIGIYGSQIKTRLVMTTICLAEDQLVALGKQLQHIDDGDGCFEMAVIQRVDSQTLKLVLLHEGGLENSYRNTLLGNGGDVKIVSPMVKTSAELLYFHGPHFQDRYGVADAALSTLKKNQLDILACGCSGTSIYLVIPENNAQLTADALAPVFLVPKLS